MKARFLALAALVLGLASCQTDPEVVNPVVDAEVDFQLAVATPELATRAGEDGAADTQNAYDSAFGAIDYLQTTTEADAYRVDWKEVDLRYTLEVYDVKDGAVVGTTPVKDRQVIIKDSYEPVVFDLRLVPNRDYRFVVFADFVAEGGAALDATAQLGVAGIRHQIGDTLADIEVINESINDEVGDAYFATKDIKVTNSTAQDIVLRRPYGKVRVIATDLAELNLNVHPYTVEIEYDAYNSNVFNAVTGTINGQSATAKYTTTFINKVRDNMANHIYNAGYDAKTATAVNGTERNTHITLATDYILALPEGQTPIHFTMVVKDEAGVVIKETAFTTDIPVERNKLTTVIGNVLTTATEIEVRIDDNFAGENIIETDEVADQASFLKALEEAAKKEYAAIELTSDVEWETGASHGSTPLIGADAKTKSLTIYGNGRTFTATGKGVGPIRMANDGKLIFQDVVFVDESVSYNEGAWELGYLEFAGELEFINCEFKNAVMMCGGTANNDTGANAKFTGCKFNSGDANQYDVWVSGDNAYFNECTFEGYRGIKVHEAYGSEVTEVKVNNCFFNNLAKKPGMAIGTLNAETAIAIENSRFVNCQAGDQGLYIYETDTDVTTFNFTEQNNVIAFVDANLTKTLTLKAGAYDLKNVTITTTEGAAIAIAENAEVTIYVSGNVKLNGKEDGIAVPDSSKLTIEGVAETRANEKFGNLNVVANGGFGIGGVGAEVTIKNTTIDYICGWPIQPLFINDTNYGKSEPEGYSAIGGAKITLENVEVKKAEGGSKAAAIGNRYWQSTDITIKNSILGDIFGGNASAAIGGSRYSGDDTKHTININIEGTTITNAVGGQFAAGIGAGYDTHCSANDSNAVNNIVIANSDITVKGGQYGAGIGTGYHSAALTGSITASTINATDGGSRDKYTAAMPVGYGVVDPTREFKDANVTFTVDGEVIAYPATLYKDADSLAKALTANDKNIAVTLYNDIDLPISSLGTITGGSGEYKLGGEATETITIDLNGKTLNITTTYWSNLGAKNANALFTIKNGTMTSSQATGTWNSYDLTFSNCDYVFENVEFAKAVAFDNAGKTVTMNDVTINETHDYYAMWITAAGQTVNIDGLTVESAGRGIKIDEQYVGTPAKVTLNVKDANFTTKNKAAIMVKSAKGADITLENVNIANVAADPAFAVWVDEDAADYADLVTVTGGLKKVEGSKSGVVASTQADFDEAVKNTETSTIVLTAAGTYNMPATGGKELTIIGNKDVIINAGAANMGDGNVTLEGVTITAGSYKGFQHSGVVTYNNVTIQGQLNCYGKEDIFNNCTFELNNTYVWTYGSDKTIFNGCTFNTTGKAILIYNEGAGACNVEVTNCTFNATAGAKAGAIANQNCAAIEIDNFKQMAHKLTTSGNTVNSNFSGEWRIKSYNEGAPVTVNGVEYTYIALDGKKMTIDGDKNVTVVE